MLKRTTGFLVLIPAYAALVHQFFELFDSRTSNVDEINISIIIIINILFLSFLFIKNEKVQDNYFISIISIVLILYIIDIGAVFWRKVVQNPAPIAGPEEVTERAISKLTGERIKDAETWSVLYPVDLTRSPLFVEGVQTIPLSGLSKVKTLLCNEAGFWVQYRADRYGFRNVDQKWDGERPRIMMLGDSFTHGFCVHFRDTIAGGLESHYGKILNLGMSGDDPLTELATLKEYLDLARPQLLLQFYYEGNDLLSIVDSAADPILRQYLKPGFRQNLEARRSEIEIAVRKRLQFKIDFAKSKSEIFSRFKEVTHPPLSPTPGGVRWIRGITGHLAFSEIATLIRKMIDTRYPRLFKGTSPGNIHDSNAATGLASQTFQETVHFACSRGTPLIFVYLPDVNSIVASVKHPEKKGIINAMRRTGAPVIEVTEALLKYPKPKELVVGHFNAKGYKIIIDEIVTQLDKLISNGRLDQVCRS